MKYDLSKIRGRRGLKSGTALPAIRRFAKEEDGTMVIFACFMILIMIAVGGVGVDLMRNEMERTRLQAVADRAVLAAADLDQPLEPEAVVRDYFEKSGMGDYVSNVYVTEGLNYRTVKVDATTTMKTQFMGSMGVETLTVPATSTAEEKVNKVEISMVLDISGSMGWNNKMQNLRNAAKVFVDTVLKEENEDLISVSVVPYSAHVNAGKDIFDQMDVSPGPYFNETHDYSHCIEFDDADFNDTLIGNQQYLQAQHFQRYNAGRYVITSPVCPKYDYEAIQAFSQDKIALKGQIDQLTPRSNTSIFLGMKWGVALLDPSFNAINSGLVGQGLVDPVFGNRPASYSDNETLKTVILMTDGQNVATDRIDNRYYNSSSERAHWARYNFGWWMDNRVSWRYHDNWYYQKYSASQGDNLLHNICEAAKDQKIIVWSIGFEVTDHGAAVMNDCASSPSHFFRVEGIEISEAFEAIARQINQLRLTQ
ncbi:MAG: pilus assembly protein TadG-related protein [Sulfitobacter sp.]